MVEIRAVGMALYTYAALEEKLDVLWSWIEAAEEWSGRPFAEYYFTTQAKSSRRFWKATPANRARLYSRLQAEQPWSGLWFGWPGLRQEVSQSGGVWVDLMSRPQPARGTWRRPSVVGIFTGPAVVSSDRERVPGLLSLGRQLWSITGAVCGLIDIRTDVSPLDDFRCRIYYAFGPADAPEEVRREMYLRQTTMSHLDRRVWKAFWGNFLSAEHLRQIGGIRDIRRSDPLNRLLPEYLERAYAQGRDRLRTCGGYHEWHDLSHGGVLLTLSPSPLDALQPEVHARQSLLQEALGRVALGPWDLEDGTADIALGKFKPES